MFFSPCYKPELIQQNIRKDSNWNLKTINFNWYQSEDCERWDGGGEFWVQSSAGWPAAPAVPPSSWQWSPALLHSPASRLPCNTDLEQHLNTERGTYTWRPIVSVDNVDEHLLWLLQSFQSGKTLITSFSWSLPSVLRGVSPPPHNPQFLIWTLFKSKRLNISDGFPGSRLANTFVQIHQQIFNIMM